MKKWQRHIILITALVAGLNLSVQASSKPAEEMSLAGALKAAATLHPQVKSKIAELNAYGFRVEEARSAWLPTVSYEAQSLRNSSNHGTVQLKQPVFSFGKIEGNIAVTEQRANAARLSLLQVRRQLMEDTASAYVNCLGAQKRLEISEKNVTEHDRLYQMILRRQQGGVASEADVRMALSRFIQAKAQRDQLKGLLDKTNNELEALTQVTAAVKQPVDENVAKMDQSQIMETLPDKEATIRIKRAELEVAKSELNLRKAELMPTLSLLYARDVSPLQSSSSSVDRYGIYLQGDLEGMGVVGSKRVHAGDALVTAAQESVNQANNEVKRRVTSMMTEKETQFSTMMSYDQSVKEMERTLDSFLRQYDAGRKSWLDVLNSQRELHDARQQYVQARTSWLEISLRLAALSGGLDQLAEVTP